ncbi:hypothetical protein NDU88_003319 [Pleurodeles waltl]|uniref:Uncharacterized protein n=1 Tax=Pleurodeles waltl TaxID=8319 RepID=A0AAV7KXT7_PLEWA|nr:hypothetical protein NDU88_003319 [Pleurodeles waltl]
MLFVTQVGTASYPCTPYQPARGVIKRGIQDVVAAVVGLAGFVRALPHTLQISMTPKTARNSGDKTDGAKITRIGKDKGDSAGANRRPISTMAKPIGKNTTGLGRDAKTDDNTTPLLEVRGKGKRNSQFVTETIPLGTYREKTLTEIKETLIKAAQGGDGLSGALDRSVATRRKERGSPTSKEGLQVQQSENLIGVEAASDTIAILGTEVVQNMPPKPKGWDKEIEKDLKPSDWAKDSGDTFYSLTMESDLSSGEHSLSESSSSVSSETGNISSSNEPIVRQLRRQRKCTKICPGPQEGNAFSTSRGSKTLKWDYSGIRLTDTPTTNGQQSVNNNMEGSTGGPISSACMGGADSGMLQLIYNSIKELQTETRMEIHRASVATKRLQGTVRKVAKSCTEIDAKLGSMDERIAAVEDDVDALKQQCVTQDGQLTDIMWKLEDYENRQRRNNLRFLGIDEGLEGSDIQAYMIKLLWGAFPELGDNNKNSPTKIFTGVPKLLVSFTSRVLMQSQTQ